MRFAIIGSRGFPSTYGGYETLVRHLAPYLSQAGHHVAVYCRTRDEGRRHWMTEGVECIAPRGIDTKSASTLSYGLTSCVSAARRGFDAALVLNIANGYYLGLLHRAGIPMAVNTDGLEWERGKWNALGKQIFRAGGRLTAGLADVLIADSRSIAQRWREAYGVDSTFIPYGGDIVEGARDHLLTPLGLRRGSYMLVVARLIPENNVELALDAVRGVARPDFPLVVVGSANFDSPLERHLLTRSHDGTVRWLGHVGNQQLLAQLWANSGVYIHGHSVGGTNPALLQALGAGAPTLALDTVFNREVLAETEQLFPKDAEALRERLRTVLEDAEQRGRMRSRGQDIIRSRYSWGDVCRRYMDVLERLATR